jgi:photosystem II stability/assembly factor-like uncharacterized protein
MVSERKVGAAPSRLWRTDDGGKTWRELAHNLPREGFGRLQFVTASVGWLLQNGVWRTDDGGVTWRRLPLTAIEEETSFSRMLFLNSMEGFVTGKGTIYHTEDGGETWTLRYNMAPARRAWLWGLQFPTPTEGWAVSDGTDLLHTLNSGRTWRPVRVRHPRMGPYDAFTSVHFLSPQVGVLAGQHSERETARKAVQRRAGPVAFTYYRAYVLVTFDGGRSWTYHDLPIPVGQWSQAGPNLLYGINTVDATHEAAGIVEVRLNPSQGKPTKR